MRGEEYGVHAKTTADLETSTQRTEGMHPMVLLVHTPILPGCSVPGPPGRQPQNESSFLPAGQMQMCSVHAYNQGGNEDKETRDTPKVPARAKTAKTQPTPTYPQKTARGHPSACWGRSPNVGG